MTEIKFKGVLAEKFGEIWKLNVSSVLEVFQAVQANISQEGNLFADLRKFCTHFIVTVDGSILPPHLLNSKILKNNTKVEIVPVVQGGGLSAIVLFVIGLALTVLSMVLMKALSHDSPKDVATSSRTLGKVRNVLNRNIVVPLGYGRMRVGSAVISNNFFVSYSEEGESPSTLIEQTLKTNFE